MPKLHLFISENGFDSDSDFARFILPTYDDDGEFIDSKFMSEVGFEDYEPMCIERIFVEEPIEVKELLKGASYYEQWINQVDVGKSVKTAVAVYEPNTLVNPQNSTIEYVGSFIYSDNEQTSKRKYEVSALVDKIYIKSEKKCELMGYYQRFNVEADSPEDAENITVDLIRNDVEIKNVWAKHKQKNPPMIYAEEIVEVEEFSNDFPNNRSGRAFFPAKKWWQFWIR